MKGILINTNWTTFLYNEDILDNFLIELWQKANGREFSDRNSRIVCQRRFIPFTKCEMHCLPGTLAENGFSAVSFNRIGKNSGFKTDCSTPVSVYFCDNVSLIATLAR